jgi:hypothetical protein
LYVQHSHDRSNNTNDIFNHTDAQDIVRHFRSGLQVIQHYMAVASEKDKNHYAEFYNQFLLTKALITHHIILDTNCHAVPLNPAAFPKDFHEVIGTRLPNELYYLISQGIVSPTPINSLITGVILEPPPLADTQEYRNNIAWLAPMRSIAISLLSTCLNDHHQRKPVNVVSWYTSEQQALERSTIKLTDNLCWQFTDADVQKNLKQQKAQNVDAQFCLGWKPSATVCTTLSKITTAEQLRAFVMLKSLDLLDYFNKRPNSTQYDLNQYGKALQKAKIYPDQSMVVLELLRHQLLSNKAFTPVFKRYTASAKSSKKNKFESELTLILRVVSLVPMQLKPNQVWAATAGVNNDLMSFNSIVKSTYRSLRQIYESLIIALFLQGYIGNDLAPELIRLSAKLPFFQEANTAMGVVSRYLLETPVDDLDVDQIAKKFNSCVDVVIDFRDFAMPFWNQVLAMVRILYSSGKTSSSSVDNKNGAAILEQFESADKFLQDRLGQISSFLMNATTTTTSK